MDLIDLRPLLSPSRLLDKWIFKTGGLFVAAEAERRLLSRIGNRTYDLVWVDAGELVGPGLVRTLRKRFGPAINYHVDDPFGARDNRRWRLYRAAVPDYDLLVVVRDVNVVEARALGARNVKRVFRSADEVAHRPRTLTEADRRQWANDVVFVGTWMPERGPLLAALIKDGIPLAIFGNEWQKAPEWPVLASAWKGPGLHGDDDYAKAIQCSKIALGLISKGNRDLHTTRSAEIPYLGGLFLAERTSEHEAMYRDGDEAVFWSSAAECADKCRRLLADREARERIAAAGRTRCIADGHLNEPVLASILAELL